MCVGKTSTLISLRRLWDVLVCMLQTVQSRALYRPITCWYSTANLGIVTLDIVESIWEILFSHLILIFQDNLSKITWLQLAAEYGGSSYLILMSLLRLFRIVYRHDSLSYEKMAFIYFPMLQKQSQHYINNAIYTLWLGLILMKGGIGHM